MEENNSNEYCSDVIVVGEMVGFAYQSFHYLGQYSDLKHINTEVYSPKLKAFWRD